MADEDSLAKSLLKNSGVLIAVGGAASSLTSVAAARGVATGLGVTAADLGLDTRALIVSAAVWFLVPVLSFLPMVWWPIWLGNFSRGERDPAAAAIIIVIVIGIGGVLVAAALMNSSSYLLLLPVTILVGFVGPWLLDRRMPDFYATNSSSGTLVWSHSMSLSGSS